MAFGAWPASTAPQTRDMAARGSATRDSRAGTWVMIRPSACMTSTVRCGRAVCPPGPDSRTSTRSQAAVIGPTRSPSRPTSRCGSQCRPKIRSTSSSPPASITSCAPPGMTSSAGWKMQRTRPWGRSGASTRASAAPSRIVVCASCPQAWHIPGTVERYGTALASGSGSASRSARSATTRGPVPTSHHRPLPPGSTFGDRPAADRRSISSRVVSCSARPASGWACNRRRTAMRSAS
jgi:hypothetical protein